MYSPKISEDLVKKLYAIAKENSLYMTTLVNSIVRKAIAELETDKESIKKFFVHIRK